MEDGVLKVLRQLKVTLFESIKIIQEREHRQTKMTIILLLVTLNWGIVSRKKLAFFTLFLLDSSFHLISDFFKLIKNIVMDMMNWILCDIMLLNLVAFRFNNLVKLSAHHKLYLIKVELGQFNVPLALLLDLLPGFLILRLIIQFTHNSLILLLHISQLIAHSTDQSGKLTVPLLSLNLWLLRINLPKAWLYNKKLFGMWFQFFRYKLCLLFFFNLAHSTNSLNSILQVISKQIQSLGWYHISICRTGNFIIQLSLNRVNWSLKPFNLFLKIGKPFINSLRRFCKLIDKLINLSAQHTLEVIRDFSFHNFDCLLDITVIFAFLVLEQSLHLNDRVEDFLELLLWSSLLLRKDSHVTELEKVRYFLMKQEKRLSILSFSFFFIELEKANFSLSWREVLQVLI